MECNERTYAEMLALPDPGISTPLGNNESDSDDISSENETIKSRISSRASRCQIISPSSKSTEHNIHINYNHNYSMTTKNGNQIDISTILEDIVQYSKNQSPSAMIVKTKKMIETEDISLQNKKRKLILDDSSSLIFTASDISDPPHLKYSNNLDGLLEDWEDSSYLIIKGVSIPLKYWSQVFRWAKPDAWNVLKTHWSNWKVLSLIVIRKLRIS